VSHGSWFYDAACPAATLGVAYDVRFDRLLEVIGHLFGNHHSRQMGIGPHHGRHDRGVDDAQPAAADHPAVGIAACRRLKTGTPSELRAMDEGRTDQVVFFAFDLLFLYGVSTAQLPLIKRKELLQRLFKKEISGLRYSEHAGGDGPRFRAQPCKLGLERRPTLRPG
jgi:hypothetical protein